ncbi:hypothetical protein Q5P01_004112 [Channa striata]|uniref:VASt domain-containing protein n=1 Tax=Channa striata TaxID=64152 RepID=A0AA88NIT2_CHASR|nr:hypothetical protein Q5P01_004112 [Channa striata]
MHLQQGGGSAHVTQESCSAASDKLDFFFLTSLHTNNRILGPLRVSATEEMDQVSNRSGVASDITDETTTSLVDFRWSTDEEQSSDPQGQCLAAPQTPVTSYKQRFDEFKKLFKELPESERLLVDYPCALQRDILLQGRLYLSENWLCFYSNVFRGTKIILALKDIVAMTREKTARLIPNAIQFCTDTEKFFFSSFSAREKSYLGIFRMWQNTLLDKPLTSLELWQMVKQHYGQDLGLSHEEMEGLQMSAESSMQTSLSVRPGGDEGLGKVERIPSCRLPVVEQVPLETSTPQGEDLLSPCSQNSANTDDSRNTPSQRRSPVPSLDRITAEQISKRSSLSLDLNANENGLSEQSGSESLEEVEDRVGVSQVQGRLYLNKVFHISANKMFELLFTDSSFVRRFMTVRKITNTSFSAWQKDSSGNMKRSLNYTITISNPLIGKFSTATENQTLYKESRDVTREKCRLRVYTDVKYKKQPWGLVKSFITKNSWSGIEDYFRQLEAELLEEEAEMNQGGGDPGKMGGLRRRRRTYSRTLPDHMKPNKQYGQDPDQHRDGSMGHVEMKGPHRWNMTTIVAWMSVILLILTVLNLGLFFKLWAMEDVAHRMYLSTKHRLRERSEASLAHEYGPRQEPGFRTREEMHLLKTVLQDSINLLEQLRSSLVVLQQNFALANRTAATVAASPHGSVCRLSVMKKRANKVEEEGEVLCCCEYVNRHGERSHVAACCCDCEDLDDACDRFLKREPQSPESLSKVATVITDRIRVPWLWGGARKVDLSVIPPLILLPVLLNLAALHFLLGMVVLTALPGLVLWYYYFTHHKKGRTLFFLSLALFSLGYMYYLFITEVFPRGDVSSVQLAVVTVGVVLTLGALIHTKKDPGIVRPNQEAVHSTVTYYSPLANRDPVLNGGWQDVMMTVTNRAGLPDAEVELKESSRKNWCSVCRVERPPRAGHCRICGVCVLRLDHHCVWINSCVGQANHRSFLLTLVFFLLTSLYGIGLVLQSVCPRENLLTALLYCPGVYNQYSTALCFTCAWYSSIVTGGLLHLLLVQVINISYNTTEREARVALRNKTARTAYWGLIVDTGVYSQGFRSNWAEFMTMGDKMHPPSHVPTDLV